MCNVTSGVAKSSNHRWPAKPGKASSGWRFAPASCAAQSERGAAASGGGRRVERSAWSYLAGCNAHFHEAAALRSAALCIQAIRNYAGAKSCVSPSPCTSTNRGLTLRWSRRAPAWRPGREAPWFMMRLAARAPCLRARLSSNVRHQIARPALFYSTFGNRSVRLRNDPALRIPRGSVG